MEKNYTPLDIDSLYAKKPALQDAFNSTANTILLILATLTVLIISIVLFVIIEKSAKGHARNPNHSPITSSGVLNG